MHAIYCNISLLDFACYIFFLISSSLKGLHQYCLKLATFQLSYDKIMASEAQDKQLLTIIRLL